MPNGVPAFEAAPYIVAMWESIGKDSWQGAAGRRQEAENN